MVGHLAHQLLVPPMTIQSFDKSHGVSRLYEERVGPRVNLRWLGSFRTLIIIFVSLLFGHLVYASPIFGVSLLIAFKIVIILAFCLYEFIKNFW